MGQLKSLGRFFTVALFIFLLVAIGQAQDSRPVIKKHNFISFSTGDGLAQSQVRSVYMDSRGYLWAATNGGLSRYNGLTFENYYSQDGLSGNQVNDILEDNNGNIWIATENGLDVLIQGMKTDGKHLIYNFSEMNGLPGKEARCIYKAENGDLWFGFDNGVAYLDNDRNTINAENGKVEFQPIHLEQGSALKDPRVNCITGKGDEIYIGYQLNVVKWTNGTAKVFELRDDMTSLKSLHPLTDGAVIIGSNNGIFTLYTGGLFDNQPIKNRLEGMTVYDIFIKESQTIWFGTDKGLYSYKYNDGSRDWASFTVNEGLSSNIIFKITADEKNNLWLGTNGGGLVKFSGQRFTRYTLKAGEEISLVSAIVQDKRNRIWFGSFSGLYIMEDEMISPFVISNFFRQFSVSSLLEDKKENLWYGIVDYGVFRYNGISFIQYTTSEGLVDDHITCMLESNNVIWFGSTNGLSILDNGSFINYNAQNGLKVENIYTISGSSDGTHWIGSDEGLIKATGDPDNLVFRMYTTEDGLPNNRVKSIATSASGIWVATDEGLGFFNGQQFDHVTMVDGLSSNVVNSVLNDNNGNIWLGTNVGIDRLALDEYERNGKKKIRNYGKNEGFTGIECNPDAIMIDSDQNIWFGTIKGAVRYNPEEDVVYDVAPDLQLVGVRLFFESVEWSDYSDSINNISGLPVNLALKYDQNYLTFDFLGINLSSPEKVKYQHQLIGFDQDWMPPSGDRSVTYSNLPPGKYTFKVRASNDQETWSEQPLAFSFMIKPPFWSTAWFLFLTITISLLLVVMILYSIFNRKVKQKELDKRIANLKLNAMRAQMNPHFVFNSLNSIQNFINKNDEESANIYLAKFASLMRFILENSRKSDISVAEEIGSLRLYLELEKLRFKDKFDYSIEVDPDINQEEHLIPAMLIQPDVENAINHGIMHLHGGGRINISMKLEGEKIICIIEDNGVGRIKADELKSKQMINHRSAAMGITKERLEILNTIRNNSMSVKIHDMLDVNKEAAGTKVEISIPVS
ncbi:MAG: histidine kinase [Bacteroidetes bacterium]|nr:histidine kinase [Bacteroidota bacterium]